MNSSNNMKRRLDKSFGRGGGGWAKGGQTSEDGGVQAALTWDMR